MYLTGFADEASVNLEGQIKVTKELGWKYIESRNINGKNIHDLSEEEFDKVENTLKDSGVSINCFGSAIANWSKKIDESFDSSLEEIKRSIPRMHRLGAKLIRVMSFAVLKENEPENQMKEERFERVRKMVDIFTKEGLTPVHENCMNFGGLSWQHTIELAENVPGLRFVYDTGNPVFTDDHSKEKPYPKQSSWEFYDKTKHLTEYVHIKDGWMEDDKTIFCYPGEGKADVKKIVKDLLDNGYDGGFSIEPHMGAVYHDPSITNSDEAKYAIYLEYGKRFEKMIADCR